MNCLSSDKSSEQERLDASLNEINIGVVIVNYNSSSYLLRALHALSLQTLKPSQIIIFDNASVEILPEEINHFDLPITLIQSEENLGFAMGNNKAIEYLNSDINWIALVNPDAYPHPNWLEEMVKAINQFPQYSFFASKLICDNDPHLLDGTGDLYHISGKAWRQNHKKPLDKAPKKIQEVFSPCAAAALYKKEAFVKVGGFDEHFFCYYEDIDLSFRLWLMGYRGCYVPEAISRHTGSATTKRHSDFYTYHGHRNLVWTYFKNMPGLLLILFLPLHLLLNFATILLFVYRKQSNTIFKAKKDAIKGLGRVFKQRKMIQKTRTLSLFQLIKILSKGLPC